MNRILRKIAKQLLNNVLPLLIAALPIAQLTDVAFVTETLGKWGVPGLVASILAAYVVAYVKESPLAKKVDQAKDKLKKDDLSVN